MTPRAMVATALMLAAFVAAAGAYGLSYCVAHLSGRPGFKTASRLSYGVLCAIATAIVALTPLYLWWKVLVAASCAAYLAIPPITLRYLKALHRKEEQSHDTRPARHSDRHQFGMFPRA